MRRRSFLKTLAFASPPVLSFAQSPAKAGSLRISAVEVWLVEGHHDVTAGVNGQHQVNPLDVYEEFRPKPYKDSPGGPTRSRPINSLYLKIKTNAGVEGFYGPIDKEVAIVVAEQLRPFLIGKDPLATEAIWDQMHRSNRHSRRGYYLMAISAVDNTLWDLRGRYYNQPVYRLLGGPTRQRVEAYVSCLGYSLEPDAVRTRSRILKDAGFRYEKWFLAYGPGDGYAGLKKNVELVKNVREALGDEIEVMFDAFSGWDLNYAIEWAKQVERYRPFWIEEAFHPEKIESFATLRRSTSVPVASGEHFYGRWEVYDYLKAGAVSIVQADPEWCGGITELLKICTVASLYDARVIPHGHSLHAALHVVASQSPMTCPLVEYLFLKMSTYYHFEKSPLTLDRGTFALPERPGFGIELDPAKVEKQSQMTWS
jgi:L-rhamnonate dehydratase